MEKRQVGRTDIHVSRLGLGCATFGREMDERTSGQLLNVALDSGINLFDTAEAYGGGQARQYRRNTLGVDDVREVTSEMHSSEKILGRWLKSSGNRPRVVLQSKVTTNFTKEHVPAAIDASLKRLQTDWIDLYLFHSFDAKTPLEDGLEALTRSIETGKVRAAGCSNFTGSQLRESLAISARLGLQRFEEVQPPFSLVDRRIEAELLPLCAQEQIGIITYSPLGAGFLSGKYERTCIPKGSRFDVIPGHAEIYFTDQKFAVVEHLRRKSAETGQPMACLAMGWALRKPGITSVLVGASRLSHLENAVEAMRMDFPTEWMREMDAWGTTSEQSG